MKLWLYQSECAKRCHLGDLKPQVFPLAHTLCSSGLAGSFHIILSPGLQDGIAAAGNIVAGNKEVINCSLLLKLPIPLLAHSSMANACHRITSITTDLEVCNHTTCQGEEAGIFSRRQYWLLPYTFLSQNTLDSFPPQKNWLTNQIHSLQPAWKAGLLGDTRWFLQWGKVYSGLYFRFECSSSWYRDNLFFSLCHPKG